MATTWEKYRGSDRSRTATQGTSESAPSSGSDGIALESVLSIVPVLHAPAGETFTGVGQLLGYVLPHGAERWVRAPGADRDMTDLAGLDEAALVSINVLSPLGRFAFVADSVGLSGGTTFTIDYVCVSRGGGSA